MASYPIATSTDENQSHGLTTGEKYAIGFGVPLLVIGQAILGFLIWSMLRRRRAAAGANDGQEITPSTERSQGTANTSNRRAMGAPPPVAMSSVGVIREPEQYIYQEYGGYFADDVGRGGGWSTTGRGQG